jgi:hypothetical protein
LRTPGGNACEYEPPAVTRPRHITVLAGLSTDTRDAASLEPLMFVMTWILFASPAWDAVAEVVP